MPLSPEAEVPGKVINWLKLHFDDFAAAFPGAFETVEVVTKVAGQDFRALFLASTAADWVSEVNLPAIVGKATPAGLVHLERAMRGKAWRPVVAGKAAMICTEGFSSDIQTRIGSYTFDDLKKKLWTEASKFSSPHIGYYFWEALPANLDVITATPEWTRIMTWFASTPMGAPKDVRLLTRAEVEAVVLEKPWGSPGNYAMMGYPYGDLTFDMKLQKLFGWGRTVFVAPVGPFSGSGSPFVAFSYPQLGGGEVNQVDFRRLSNNVSVGPAGDEHRGTFSRESSTTSYGYTEDNALLDASQAGLIDKLGTLVAEKGGVLHTGRRWLPLFGPPGDYQMGIVGNIDEVVASVSVTGNWTHRTIDIRGDVYTAIPMDWYTTYVLENPKAANKVDLEKAKKDLEQYAGHTLCAVSLQSPWAVPSNPVERLKIYAEYKKSREKACKENDFLTKPFAPGITFGAAQAKLVSAGPLTELFSYRDPSSVPTPVDVSGLSMWEGFTLTWVPDTKVVTTRRPDGTFGPQIGAGDAETFVEAAYGGSTLVGATVEAVIAAWGLSASDIVSRSAGLKESNASIALSNRSQGSELSYTAFDWRAITVNGYPVMTGKTADEAVRIALTSVNCVAKLGTKMRRMLLSYGQDALIASALVPPPKPTIPGGPQ